MTELAQRLAAARERDEAAAEAEPPETEEEEATEEEGEPQTEPAPSEPPPAEGLLSADQAVELEKATTAYLKRATKAFAPAEPPPLCPTCEGLGFDLTYGAHTPELATNDAFRACTDCKGLGQVLTGSKVEGHVTRDCPTCLGRGYLERLPAPAAVPNAPEEYGTPSWMGTVPPTPGP